jgi:hypothetical protein
MAYERKPALKLLSSAHTSAEQKAAEDGGFV